MVFDKVIKKNSSIMLLKLNVKKPKNFQNLIFYTKNDNIILIDFLQIFFKKTKIVKIFLNDEIF